MLSFHLISGRFLMEQWHLLYCKRGQLERAIAHLRTQYVSCFTPKVTIQKMVRGKYITQQASLFPNYLFAKFDYHLIHTTTIQATRGVSHLVRFGNQLAVIPAKLVEQLQSHPHAPLIDNNVPRTGDKVIILDGVFTGVEAIYKEPDGEKRAILLLTILNKETPKSIANHSIRKSEVIS